MSAIGDYLKDTRTELKHVTWPTQMQTIVYTILVIAISVGIAIYLGFFDYLFTGALSKTINVMNGVGAAQTQVPNTAQAASSSVPAIDLNFGTTTQK